MMAMAHFNIVQNSIVQKTTYNSETGGQTTTTTTSTASGTDMPCL